MAVYDEISSITKAYEMVKVSLEAGLLQPVIPKGYNDPAAAGKDTALFLGAMIKELSEQLKKL